MDRLRIVTAGSVDDGKSTLLGHLMAQCGALKVDQLATIQDKSQRLGYDYLDYSLATNGLLSEREQGITIDISNLYLNVAHRRFMLLDAPGHEEYTRNMVTGASNADAALLLIDARKGISVQTRRHLYIMNLLRVTHLVFVINKMDLVDYSKDTFDAIVLALQELCNTYAIKLKFKVIPISALNGAGIGPNSFEAMPWYRAKSLLELLEDLPNSANSAKEGVFDVQYVIRPKTTELHDYRGYAGKQRSGSVKVGDLVRVSPKGTETTIAQIERYGVACDQLLEGENGTILLRDQCDVSRGSLISTGLEELQTCKRIVARLCWLSTESLRPLSIYTLQLGSFRVRAKVTQLLHCVQLDNGKKMSCTSLELNEIGAAELQLAAPLFFKTYEENRTLGRFILIYLQSNETVGVGFI